MNFLDEPQLDISRPEADELLNMLVDAYPRRIQAELITRKAGLKGRYFPDHDNSYHRWFSLLNVMARQGILREMVLTAYEDPEVAGFQKKFSKFLDLTEEGKSDEKSGSSSILRGRKRWPGMHVSIAKEISAIARSVVRINATFSEEKASATGFLITSDCVLTNYYNLFAPEFGSLVGLEANFDFEQKTPYRQQMVVDADIGTVQGSKENYWAVFQLARPVDRPPLPLGSPFDIAKRDGLVIIQHPLGREKQFVVAPEAIREFDDKWIHYSDVTESGSAGSPVLNSVMHIVAVHHAKRKVTIEENGLEFVEWQAYGMRIEPIMSDLAAHNISYLTR